MSAERVVYKWYEKLAMEIIKNGQIPNHVAFILDGNRRFAKSSNLSIFEGHTKGGNKLFDYLQWCMDMGVREATVYAFSIENFNRSEQEVNDLMELFKKIFKYGFTNEDKHFEAGIRVNVIGDITLLPIDLQNLIANAILLTENNDKLIFNIAFAYTSQEEITNSIHIILEDCGENLHAGDINEELLRQCLYTGDFISEPDLLMRTSGNTRISDFLMWQISSTVLYFTKTFWPALKFVDFLLGILYYQRSIANMSQYREVQMKNQMKMKNDFPERVHNFLRKVHERKRDFILNLASEKYKQQK